MAYRNLAKKSFRGPTAPMKRFVDEAINKSRDIKTFTSASTGTEGASAKRRNPSRPGPMSAMKASELKRNQEVIEPDFLITGSSGNTREGQLVTFSGGARG